MHPIGIEEGVRELRRVVPIEELHLGGAAFGRAERHMEFLAVERVLGPQLHGRVQADPVPLMGYERGSRNAPLLREVPDDLDSPWARRILCSGVHVDRGDDLGHLVTAAQDVIGDGSAIGERALPDAIGLEFDLGPSRFPGEGGPGFGGARERRDDEQESEGHARDEV